MYVKGSTRDDIQSERIGPIFVIRPLWTAGARRAIVGFTVRQSNRIKLSFGSEKNHSAVRLSSEYSILLRVGIGTIILYFVREIFHELIFFFFANNCRPLVRTDEQNNRCLNALHPIEIDTISRQPHTIYLQYLLVVYR